MLCSMKFNFWGTHSSFSLFKCGENGFTARGWMRWKSHYSVHILERKNVGSGGKLNGLSRVAIGLLRFYCGNVRQRVGGRGLADSYAATRELQQACSDCDLCSAWTCRAGATAGDLHETRLQEFPSHEQSHTLKRRWQVVCGARDNLIDRYGSIHGPLLNFSVVQAPGKTPPFLKH